MRRGGGWFRRTGVAGVAGRDASPRDGTATPGASAPAPDTPYVPYAPFEHDALYGLKDQDDAGYQPYDFLPADPAPKPYEVLPRNPVSRPSDSPSWPDDPAPQPGDDLPSAPPAG
jgi:hypothetical protein